MATSQLLTCQTRSQKYSNKFLPKIFSCILGPPDPSWISCTMLVSESLGKAIPILTYHQHYQASQNIHNPLHMFKFFLKTYSHWISAMYPFAFFSRRQFHVFGASVWLSIIYDTTSVYLLFLSSWEFYEIVLHYLRSFFFFLILGKYICPHGSYPVTDFS